MDEIKKLEELVENIVNINGTKKDFPKVDDIITNKISEEIRSKIISIGNEVENKLKRG